MTRRPDAGPPARGRRDAPAVTLGQIFERFSDRTPRSGSTAYDGSRPAAPTRRSRPDLATSAALSYLITAPGDLGLARAYVPG